MPCNWTLHLGNTFLLNCNISGTPLTSNLRHWYILAAVVLAVSCLLGIPANITIVVQLSRHLRGSSMTQRLFFNLAMSDLLCLACLPLGMYIFFSGTCLMDGLYQLLLYYIIFCITADLNILMLISIQRYYQILHPEKWAKVHRMWQRVLLFSVWMLAALVALPAVFMLKADTQTGSLTSAELEVVYIFFVVFSYLVLFSFYLLLVKGVKQALNSNKKPPRATKIFIRIIAVYLVTGFFPVFFRTFYVVVYVTCSANLLYVSKMLTFMECFYFFNHCLNPFLYFYASGHRRDSNRRSHLLNDDS